MIKAVLLMLGAAAYLATVQLGHIAAMSQLAHLQLLYTSASAQATAISAGGQ